MPIDLIEYEMKYGRRPTMKEQIELLKKYEENRKENELIFENSLLSIIKREILRITSKKE